MPPAPTNPSLRASLGTHLKDLQSSLSTFTHYLEEEAHAAWLWQKPRGPADALTPSAPELSHAHTLELICEALKAIKYTDDQAPHESHIAPGLLVVSEEGLTLAEEVNRHKRGLAAVLRAMQGRTEIGVINPRTGERGPRPLREVALESFFFRRLHHWQATRELVVLRESASSVSSPDYIGFSWATCRDVRRTYREALIQQLEESRSAVEDTAHYDRDIARLTDLEPKEPLALVRPGHTTPKANIAWPAGPDGKSLRQIKPAVLPLVMFGTRLPSRLRKLPAAPTPRHFRLARVDTEIEPTPLLETLPVYRYLEHLRAAKRAEGNKTAPR
jgi:DNA replication terminus site-binding protein (Ter protein)